jgi:Skp family chaperone for outer membrane proteins
LRRGAKSRIKKLKANIKKRSKEITRAQTRGDTKTVKHQKDMQRRAQAVVAGLEKIVAQMPDDCPFTGQIDPLMS